MKRNKKMFFFVVFQTQTVVAQLSGKSSAMVLKIWSNTTIAREANPTSLIFCLFLPEIKPKCSSFGMFVYSIQTIEDHFCLIGGVSGFLEERSVIKIILNSLHVSEWNLGTCSLAVEAAETFVPWKRELLGGV